MEIMCIYKVTSVGNLLENTNKIYFQRLFQQAEDIYDEKTLEGGKVVYGVPYIPKATILAQT